MLTIALMLLVVLGAQPLGELAGFSRNSDGMELCHQAWSVIIHMIPTVPKKRLPPL
jgi:hypothetical protein